MEALTLGFVLFVVVLDVVLLSRWSHTPETEADPVEGAEASSASNGLSPLDDGPRCRRCASELEESTYRYCVDCF